MRVRGLAAVSLLAFALASCGGADQAPETGAAGHTGKAVFVENCGGCHTLAAAGTKGTLGPKLDEHFRWHMHDTAYVEEQVANGRGRMPAFEGKLGDAEIRAVSEYVVSAAGG